jgi:hypothetical protein
MYPAPSIPSFPFPGHPCTLLLHQPLLFILAYTVKGARGKVSFDSQNDKYASKLSSDVSPEAYSSLRKLKSAFVILEVRCDKYASGEA